VRSTSIKFSSADGTRNLRLLCPPARLTLLLAGLLTAADAIAEKYTLDKLIVDHVYTFATPPGALSAGGYLTITNTGNKDETLVGGSASFAKTTQVHEMKIVDDVMKMRHLEPGLEIPAGETVELAPGGLHLMFIELTQSLKDGQTLNASLTFSNAGELPVAFEVIDRRKQNGEGHDNSRKSMKHEPAKHAHPTPKE